MTESNGRPASREELRFAPRKPSEEERANPVVFWIGEERFEAIHAIPVEAHRPLSGSGGFWNLSDMIRFVEGILPDEEPLREGDDPEAIRETPVDRLRRVLGRKDEVVDIELLTHIVIELLGKIGRRPTGRPSGSPDGPGSTEASSTDAPSSEEAPV